MLFSGPLSLSFPQHWLAPSQSAPRPFLTIPSEAAATPLYPATSIPLLCSTLFIILTFCNSYLLKHLCAYFVPPSIKM